MEIVIDASSTGPLFNRLADRAAADCADAIGVAVSNQALAEVHQIADASFRNPTPYYETQLVAERVVTDYVIHDRGIVYGPWLEGVSERNRTTRFKGYFLWRRARHRTERQASAIAERVARRYIGRMGG